MRRAGQGLADDARRTGLPSLGVRRRARLIRHSREPGSHPHAARPCGVPVSRCRASAHVCRRKARPPRRATPARLFRGPSAPRSVQFALTRDARRPRASRATGKDRTMIRLLIALALAALMAVPAAAQDRRPSHCIALVDRAPGIQYLHRASFGQTLEEFTARINYVAHATFLIETPGGLTVATDYTGFLGPTLLVPDVVTMNRAHSSHWTPNPDPAIPHVLPGWTPTGDPANHHLDL